jgi:hypothetical protein
MRLDEIKDELAIHFFQYNPLRYVNGIGIGLLPDDKPSRKKLDAARKILIFVDRSAPHCELCEIEKIVACRTESYAIVHTSRFVGLQTATGGSFGYYAPFRFNLPAVSTGTFGAVMRAGDERYILGSNHVLSHNRRARTGTDVIAPSTRDATAVSLIGSVSQTVQLKTPPWPLRGSPKAMSNKVDCALAEVNPAAGINAQKPVAILDLNPALRTLIRKRGRTTGNTRSEIRVLEWDGFIGFSFGTYYFTDLFGTFGSSEFAKPGDSGSLALTGSDEKGVGLVTARAYVFDPSANLTHYITLLCSLRRVSEGLAAELGVEASQVKIFRDE